MRGWFDSFRTRGGPIFYINDNRTSVNLDPLTATVYTLFGTVYIAFIIIFPGIREKKLPTFIVVSLSLFVGAVILLANDGSSWHVSESFIKSDFRAFSKQKFEGQIGVFIGLSHVNITLKSVDVPLAFEDSNNTFTFTQHTNPNSNLRLVRRIPNFIPANYNERFYWAEPTHMSVKLKDGLYCGLPYPILTVLDYLSWGHEGFGWGRIYRSAGYYTSFIMWLSFGSWVLMVILLLVVPKYGAYQMIISGYLMLSANLIYYLLIPNQRPLTIRFEESVLLFQLGSSFWLVFVGGSLCVVVGFIMLVMEMVTPHYWSTILEVLPYDRHAFVDTSVYSKERKRVGRKEKGNWNEEEDQNQDDDGGSWEYPHLEEYGSFGFRKKAKRMIHSGENEEDPYYDNQGYELCEEEEEEEDRHSYPWKNDNKNQHEFDENANIFSFAMTGLQMMAPDDLLHFLHFQEKKREEFSWEEHMSTSAISIPRVNLRIGSVSANCLDLDETGQSPDVHSHRIYTLHDKRGREIDESLSQEYSSSSQGFKSDQNMSFYSSSSPPFTSSSFQLYDDFDFPRDHQTITIPDYEKTKAGPGSQWTGIYAIPQI